MTDHDDMADDFWDDEDDRDEYACECCGGPTSSCVVCEWCDSHLDEHMVCRAHGRKIKGV